MQKILKLVTQAVKFYGARRRHSCSRLLTVLAQARLPDVFRSYSKGNYPTNVEKFLNFWLLRVSILGTAHYPVRKGGGMRSKTYFRIAAMAAIFILVSSAHVFAGGSPQVSLKGEIAVGSKIDTEGAL